MDHDPDDCISCFAISLDVLLRFIDRTIVEWLAGVLIISDGIVTSKALVLHRQ